MVSYVCLKENCINILKEKDPNTSASSNNQVLTVYCLELEENI